tara:strand:- start:302 stop:1723 length:1422 start_codon:yes stop_codon:yes gene_type:complete
MPIGLAYVAATLEKNKINFQVIDAFGEAPNKITNNGNMMIRGLSNKEIINAINKESKIIAIYAIHGNSHISIINIIKSIRKNFHHVPIIILENSNAVTAYSLKKAQKSFYDSGANYVVTGDIEFKTLELVKKVYDDEPIKTIRGIGYKTNDGYEYNPSSYNKEILDEIPFPLWNKFPIKNYWSLRYAHGPIEQKRYLPLLTSRGCPCNCGFCVIPEITGRTWRKRSAINVVDEIEFYIKTYGVNEFHVEDLNPTVDEKRIKLISQEIMDRGLNIIWKLCSGTKAETIKKEETIALMARSGCNYISVSPESGSSKILNSMDKKVNREHIRWLVKTMKKYNIFSQACFVLGYPGENDKDRIMTRQLVKELTVDGVDEIAIFVITPLPGSSIFDNFGGYDGYSELSFSPSWRKDYKSLNSFRINLYLSFLWWKFLFNPLKMIKQPLYFLKRKYKTKMEMVPYKALHIKFLQFTRNQ